MNNRSLRTLEQHDANVVAYSRAAKADPPVQRTRGGPPQPASMVHLLAPSQAPLTPTPYRRYLAAPVAAANSSSSGHASVSPGHLEALVKASIHISRARLSEVSGASALTRATRDANSLARLARSISIAPTVAAAEPAPPRRSQSRTSGTELNGFDFTTGLF